MTKKKKSKKLGHSILGVVSIVLLSVAGWQLFKIINRESENLLGKLGAKFAFLSFLTNSTTQGIVIIFLIIIILFLLGLSGKKIFEGIIN